jgi:hypothetical protein
MRKPNREGIEPFLRYAWLLVHALEKCKPYQGRMLSRGIREKDMRKYGKDRFVVWHAFNSCSSDVPAAVDFLRGQVDAVIGFSRVLFMIELTTGRGRNISRYSMIPDEKEVLLPPNTSFKVVSEPVDAGDFFIVHMCETPSMDPLLPFAFGPTPASASSSVTDISAISALREENGRLNLDIAQLRLDVDIWRQAAERSQEENRRIEAEVLLS